MLSFNLDSEPRRTAFSSLLRRLRRLRGMRGSAVAAAMGMPLRSYQHFESGSARLNVEHLLKFADVTDTDGVALIASILLDSPELALRSADNKMMKILLLSADEFHRSAGENIQKLTAAALIRSMKVMFEDLWEQSHRPDTAATWLLTRSVRIGADEASLGDEDDETG